MKSEIFPYNYKMDELELTLQRTELLVGRLERMSADSIWAHRASGLRGSLLRLLAQGRKSTFSADADFLQTLKRQNQQAHFILENAAKEIPDPEQIRLRMQMK